MTAQITWTNITVKLGDIKPWENNPRQSTKKQAEKLLQSWREFGQVETIAVSPDLDLYNGHQRLSALLTVYGEDYVIEARQASRHLSEEEKRKLTITLHAGATGSWDWDNLSSWEPVELKEWGFDDSLLTDWRRDVASLGDFLESEEEQESRDAEPQIDRAAELQKEWGTAVGQLWRLESRTAGNEHRLIVGDCTDAGVVERLMGEEKAAEFLSDPPYGIDWNTDYTRFGGEYDSANRVNYPSVEHDNEPFDPRPYLSFDKVVLWGANWYCQHIPLGSWFIWDKRHPGGEAWLSDAEIAWSKGKQGVYIYAETVQGAHRKEKAMHPTQKPVGLFEWCIKKADMGDVICDWYCGSGTTIIAAENLSRQCRAIEIAPGYVAVALQRYQDAFGITAELIETL